MFIRLQPHGFFFPCWEPGILGCRFLSSAAFAFFRGEPLAHRRTCGEETPVGRDRRSEGSGKKELWE